MEREIACTANGEVWHWHHQQSENSSRRNFSEILENMLVWRGKHVLADFKNRGLVGFILSTQTAVGSIVWAFRGLKNPSRREMSARSYALHNVCRYLSSISWRDALSANFLTGNLKKVHRVIGLIFHFQMKNEVNDETNETDGLYLNAKILRQRREKVVWSSEMLKNKNSTFEKINPTVNNLVPL